MPEVQTATKPTPSAKEQQNVTLAIKPSTFMPVEFAYQTWSAVLPVGHTIEDTLKPEYWSQVANKLAGDTFTNRPDAVGAIIEVRSADHSFFARLYVRAVRERSLVVAMIGEPTYFGPKAVKTTGYDVRWNVGRRGFDIIRMNDGAIVAQGLKTKEEAQLWIDQTVKAN